MITPDRGGPRWGGGGSSLGIRGRSGLFAGGWPLVKANRAEISLSAWWGRSWERPFRACASRACARAAFGGAGAGVLGTGASEADAGASAGGARLGGCVISIPRSGAHAAGGPTSIPPDEPAPDGPARPTKIGRPWELDLRSWMARMVRKKPLSNVRSSSNRAIC